MHNSDGTSITLVGRYLELEESSMIRMTWRWQREGETEEGKIQSSRSDFQKQKKAHY